MVVDIIFRFVKVDLIFDKHEPSITDCMSLNYIQTYLSVDCVVFGFDNNLLNVLLVKRDDDQDNDNNLKLPGSLIYNNEDVDNAAQRVLFELTGLRKMRLKQFKCYSSPNRANNNVDMAWLDKAYQPNINRLVTVAYLSICKINKKFNNISKYKTSLWCPVDKISKLPFDHNIIIDESLIEIQHWVEYNPSIIFELLPSKFTISQLHKLYEAIYNKAFDIRNFHKKIASLSYIQVLDEKEEGVSHRAARYYKFDKIAYNKLKTNIN